MSKMAIRATVNAGDYLGAYGRFQTVLDRRIEYAALRTTDVTSRRGKSAIRSEMAGAKLGRLGNAIDSTSDLEKGRVHRTAGGFSASGVIFVRSRSERTIGAIESYTQGSTIRPKNSRYLWIPSRDIKRLAGSKALGGRFRLTPALWDAAGLSQRIGPLVFVRAKDGTPLLIVQNVGVGALGQPGSVKSLTRRGQPRRGQIKRDFVVAFTGIRGTERTSRVNVPRTVRKIQVGMVDTFTTELRNG